MKGFQMDFRQFLEHEALCVDPSHHLLIIFQSWEELLYRVRTREVILSEAKRLSVEPLIGLTRVIRKERSRLFRHQVLAMSCPEYTACMQG